MPIDEREWLELKSRLHESCGSAQQEVLDRFGPMVRSVCRRWLVEESDVEDAMQEVFVKLFRRYHEVGAGIMGWLSLTARSASVDLIRRQARERGHIHGLARHLHHVESENESSETLQVLQRLGDALHLLNQSDQNLIIERYFLGTPLRELAYRQGVSVPTMSRRVKACLDRLSEVFEAEDSEQNLKPSNHPPEKNGLVLHHTLRREVATNAWRQNQKHDEKLNPTAPLRMGVFLGYTNSITPNSDQWLPPVNMSLWTLDRICQPNISMIGVVEPDTEDLAPIENAMRQFDLLDGIIRADDVDGLKSLDVIFIGNTFSFLPRVLDALVGAIESGVGFYSEMWTGSILPGINDPRILKLMLATRAGVYHTPVEHDLPSETIVQKAHSVIPGLSPGTKITLGGCCPVIEPAPDSQVLIYHTEKVVPVEGPNQVNLDIAVRPALQVGTVGHSRVCIINEDNPDPIRQHPDLQGDYHQNIFDWLTHRENSTSGLTSQDIKATDTSLNGRSS